MSTENNMGDVFREAFKDFERKPSAKVWDNIEQLEISPIPKVNYFNRTNLIIGSASIIVLSIILYFTLPIQKSSKSITKEVRNEVIDKKQITNIIIEEKQIAQSVKESNASERIMNTVENEEVKNNNPQGKVAKKQNIHDLIAAVDKNESASVQKINQNNSNPSIASTTNNPNINQKKFDRKPINNNNLLISKTTPASEIIFSPDQTICKGEKAKLSVNGGVSFLWSSGERAQYIIVSPTESTDYSVIATDENGNRKTGIITVNVSDCYAPYIPKAFSPNGDGLSDIFKVYATDITKFEIIIVSRSGQIVYTSKNVNEGWDGTIKGSPAPAEVYVYTVKYKNELNNEQIINGHVTIIR
ncbi:MAG: T9SS type B sorting domain-containing protein [Bacteroidales bacterium]